MDKTASDHIAAAKAHLDQLIEMHRSARAVCVDATDDQFITWMFHAMFCDPPPDEDETMAIATVAVLAVDRLAQQPRPEL